MSFAVGVSYYFTLLKVLLKRISKVAFLYLKCFFNLRRTLINNQNVHNPEEAALIGA